MEITFLSKTLACGNATVIFLKTTGLRPEIEYKRKSTATFPMALRLKSKDCGRKIPRSNFCLPPQSSHIPRLSFPGDKESHLFLHGHRMEHGVSKCMSLSYEMSGIEIPMAATTVYWCLLTCWGLGDRYQSIIL